MAGETMKGFFLRWVIYFVTIFVVAHFFGLIEVASPSTLLWSALILGILNAWLKPILVLITLPISFFTLGLFVLVINTFLLKLTDLLIPGFAVDGFLKAFIASICISIISSFLNGLISDSRRRKRV
jgi:putative membrane protein